MYYPLSEITQNLYTGGGELAYRENSVPYVGYYYSTTDGRFFTGKTFSISAKELVKIVGSGTLNTSVSPSVSYLAPTNEDREKGFITRYVVKRVNCGPDTIKEVSKEGYESSLKNPIYTQASFQWYISGPLFDNLSNINYPVYGVIHKNRMIISKLETKIPGITNFFKNFAQYHQ